VPSNSVFERLRAAGIDLPPPAPAVGRYSPAIRSGGFVFTSGQLPMRDGALIACGPVDTETSFDLAVECARMCAINCLVAASAVCDLSEATPVKLTGYVAAEHSFQRHPAVMDGASNVILTAFGDAGEHTREVVGVASLPLGAPVEVSLLLAVIDK